MDGRTRVIEALQELARLTVLDERDPQLSFRVRAYEKALAAIEASADDPLGKSARELTTIRGVGKSTAAKIRELADTGRIEKLEKLREKFPPSVLELARVPGLGPRKLAMIREALNVNSVAELRQAIAEQRLRGLPGMGAKSEEKLLKSLDGMGLGSGKDRRTPTARAWPRAQALLRQLRDLEGVRSAVACGSLRRMRDTVADLDILVTGASPRGIMDGFCSFPEVRDVLARGEGKCSVMLSHDLQVDLRVVPHEQLGAAMMYFTGSKAHNIRLRQRAIDRGWLLNEYGLFDESGQCLASRTEAEVFAALDLPWIPPQLREDTGELEAAECHALPLGISAELLLGDLHLHTVLSGDGRSPLATMCAAGRARGYRYFATTDHAENLARVGVDRGRLLAQREEMRALQPAYPEMALLHGVELNIGPDGGLDYDDDFRRSFDWVVAAVHSHFDLSLERQTHRLIAAMKDPAVHAIGHISARMIGKRPPIDIDVGAILTMAVETNTAIEVNSALWRLDASTELIRRARDLGVRLCISSDAHHESELDRMQFGASWATRGWADPEMVINTWAPERFLDWIRAPRPGVE